MNIRVEYSKKEVEKIVLTAHVKQFGNPPDGYEWSAYESYGEWKVEACAIEQAPAVKQKEVEPL